MKAARPLAAVVRRSGNIDSSVDLGVAGFTHDMRGALGVIKALGALASHGVEGGDPASALGALARLDEAITKGAELCSDALECERRRFLGAAAALPVAGVDLVEVARESAALHAGVFQRARCTIELDLPSRAEVRSHRRSVERILSNLLRNAAAYGAGRPIEIHVHAPPRGAIVIVRDHGRGISSEALVRLAAPFQRAGLGAEDASFEHFGLGLWIVKSLVQSLGGRLHVASELGAGTAVSVWLPAGARATPGA